MGMSETMSMAALRKIIELLPPDATLTLPCSQLRAALAEEPPHASSQKTSAPENDRWLTAEEVGAALGMSRRWVYARAKDFPFTKRLPGAPMRFSEAGLRRWMDRIRN
jgi:predicted DNA-binding transcriptional regulator AlpA